MTSVIVKLQKHWWRTVISQNNAVTDVRKKGKKRGLEKHVKLQVKTGMCKGTLFSWRQDSAKLSTIPWNADKALKRFIYPYYVFGVVPLQTQLYHEWYKHIAQMQNITSKRI